MKMPSHQEIISSYPDDATAICGQEPERAKLASAVRGEGVAYSLSLSRINHCDTSQSSVGHL